MKGSISRLTLTVAAAVLGASVAAAASTVYLSGGKSVAIKTIRWNAANREYVVQPASGSDATLSLPLADVVRLEIDAPPEMTRVRDLMKDNRAQDAIPILQGIVTSYAMLNWDNTAREWLARIYVQNKEPAKAIAMVEAILAAGGSKNLSPGLRQKYWEALIAAKQPDKAAKDLDAAIATGPRELVPIAQVTRGDLRRAAGHKEEALDDYLRTVLFFENAGDIRAEALAKAAALLDELGDSHGGELRQKLKDQYPDSDLAKKAPEKVN